MRRQVRLLRTWRFRPDSTELVAGRARSRGSRLALSEAPPLRGEVEARRADYSRFVNDQG